MSAGFPIPYTPSEHEKKFIAHFGERGLRPGRVVQKDELRTYVLCFTNRCGSYLLAELIATNEAFGRAIEYLNADGVIKMATERQLKSLAQYLQWLRRTKASANNILGIKLAYRQLFFLIRTGLMPRAFGNVQFVHIRRRDTLGQAVSHLIAAQTKVWTSKQVKRFDEKEVTFKEAQIARIIDGIHEANAKFRAFFDVYGIRPVEVVYEDLIQDMQAEGNRIVREIGFAGDSATIRADMITLRKQRNSLNESFVQRMRQHYDLYGSRFQTIE